MSIDAGGLAQMTYQSPMNGAIGVSGPGFASRGQRLSHQASQRCPSFEDLDYR